MITQQKLAILGAALIVWMAGSTSVHGQYGYGGYGGGSNAQALAHVNEKGNVVIRRFFYGVVAAPPKKVAPDDKDKTGEVLFQPEKVPPKVEKIEAFQPKMHEQRFELDPKELDVRTVHGSDVAADAWRKALAKESAVLYLAAAFDEYDLPRGASEPPPIPGHLRQIYKQGTLVISPRKPPLGPQPMKEATDGAPKLPAPFATQAVFQVNKTIQFRNVYEEEFLTKMVVQKKGADGKPMWHEIEVRHKNKSVSTHEVPAEYYSALDAQSKPIAADRMPKLLTKEQYVLNSTSGLAIDPFYLQLLRPDVVILVMPMPPAPMVSPGPPKVGE